MHFFAKITFLTKLSLLPLFYKRKNPEFLVPGFFVKTSFYFFASSFFSLFIKVSYAIGVATKTEE